MRTLGAFVSALTGGALFFFSLAAFFAHSLIRSLWSYIAAGFGVVGNAQLGEMVEANVSNVPVLIPLMLAGLACAFWALAYFLVAGGSVASRRRVTNHPRNRPHYPRGMRRPPRH